MLQPIAFFLLPSLLLIGQQVHGGPMDLAGLVHQYEDQMLGRQTGINGIDEEAENTEDVNTVGHPYEVHGWDSALNLGQVSAVDVNLDDDPVIFHRGPVTWESNSFDSKNVLVARHGPAIQVNTIQILDGQKGKVKSGFGKDLFYMPHGLNIDHEGATWITDVGLHQVMKFPAGQTKPSLVLGEKFIPGNDKHHFCKPTATVVASSGHIFVADGYCNSRVAVFDYKGKHMYDLTGNWLVVHSIVLYEPEDIICIADREGKKIDCIGAGLRNPQFKGQISTTVPNLGRVFAIAGRGSALLAVNGRGSFYDPKIRGVTLDLAAENQVVDVWGEELSNPHDVAISRGGDAVYVAEIGPNRLRKFEVVTPASEMF